MFSYWEKDVYSNNDVLIVGGGITGLLTAIQLLTKNENLKVNVIERSTIAYGASTRNAGFGCFGSPSELLMNSKSESMEELIELVERRRNGIAHLKLIASEIDVAWTDVIGYDCTGKDHSVRMDFAKELNEHLGDEVYFDASNELKGKWRPKGIEGLIGIRGEAQIHPMKLIDGLRRKVIALGGRLLNGFEVLQIHPDQNKVEIIGRDSSRSDLKLKGRSVVVATNGFTWLVPQGLEQKPGRGQVLITSKIENLPFKGNFHLDDGYFYFRNVGKRVLFGGGRNLDENKEMTTRQDLNVNIQTVLENRLRQDILPYYDFKIETRWSGIMSFGESKKVVEESIGSVHYAYRYGGMGIALASDVAAGAANRVLKQLQ